MGAVWKSLREYAVVVAKQWWFYISLVSGILALIGQVASVPPIPRGITIAGFMIFLSFAQFAAFHQLRRRRDEGQEAGFSLLAQAQWWHIAGYAYVNDPRGITLQSTPEAFAGNPEVRLNFVTDIEMDAHGGAKGGVLFKLTWTIQNLPDRGTFEPPIVVMPITLAAGEGDPLRSRLSIQLDKVRLADLRRAWEKLPGDPVLAAEYHIKGKTAAVQTRLTLPRSGIIEAIPAWRKIIGLPPED